MRAVAEQLFHMPSPTLSFKCVPLAFTAIKVIFHSPKDASCAVEARASGHNALSRAKEMVLETPTALSHQEEAPRRGSRNFATLS